MSATITGFPGKDNTSTQHYLMCKDVPLFLFTVQDNLILSIDEIYNQSLLPEVLKSSNTGNFSEWLIRRQIDTSRPNAKLLLKL